MNKNVQDLTNLEEKEFDEETGPEKPKTIEQAINKGISNGVEIGSKITNDISPQSFLRLFLCVGIFLLGFAAGAAYILSSLK